jgi:DHA1 family bicyclomycin/chloramphenicol resistance-like MFS transporter
MTASSAPGTREMTVDARRADGAQRLRDRRDDPGAAGDRPRLGVAEENRRSWSSSPISRLRRRQLLLGAARRPLRAQADPRRRVALYGLFALLCGVAGSFELLIAGRVAMGASAAVTRVLVVAMVRDLFEARRWRG